MNLKGTIGNLRKLGNKSTNERYVGDATEYAFREHILRLLAEIAKQKIEEDTYTPQEAGKQRFRCAKCEAEGYIEEWNEQTKQVKKIIKDCPDCKGEGFIDILVVDKRKKTKKKDLYYDDVY